MPPWIDHLLVVLLIGSAVLLLARRLRASFGPKKCGCDTCPTKPHPPAPIDTPHPP